jgi:hypothetical protein
MLTILVVVLIALWALGILGGYTMGGLIHLLLLVALLVIVTRLVNRRRVA